MISCLTELPPFDNLYRWAYFVMHTFLVISYLTFIFYVCRSVDEILQRLTPYFEIDYLLPRSFMASLKMKELEPVISSNTIPLEVSLAALFYYLKSRTDEVSLILAC